MVRAGHLWLGLTLGGLFALLGVSGSLLVFYPELDALLHPEISVVGAVPPDWDRAVQTLRTAYPDKLGAWRLDANGAGGAIPARYYHPPERAGHDFRPMMVWLSGDGSRVLRRDYWGEYAATMLYDFHYRLLLGGRGGRVLGWAGFGLLALLASGIWAWWPRGSLAKALRFKRGAAPQRRLRDWHKLAGLLGLPVLLILTGSGVMLELPRESDAALVRTGLLIRPMPRITPAPACAAACGTASGAIRAALAALPEARLAWIQTPPQGSRIYQLRLQVPGDPGRRFPHSYVWVDGASSRVIARYDVRRSGNGGIVNAWLHPLHDGSAFGLLGRLVVAFAGLIPALLLWTGWRRWSRRTVRAAAVRAS
jgi:uncharacterized iron-regulated membrane protein